MMVMIITGVGSLIHLYSIGYMSHDKGFYKFFTYLNLFIFSMGRLYVGAAPIMPKGGFVDPTAYADPLPQALVLTAIVITFGMTALTVILSLRSFLEAGTDQVDGQPDADASVDAGARA